MRCRLSYLMAVHEPPLTQLAVIEATGLSSHTVGRLYHNTFSRVDSKAVDALTEFFGCEVGDLFVKEKSNAKN